MMKKNIMILVFVSFLIAGVWFIVGDIPLVKAIAPCISMNKIADVPEELTEEGGYPSQEYCMGVCKDVCKEWLPSSEWDAGTRYRACNCVCSDFTGCSVCGSNAIDAGIGDAACAAITKKEECQNSYEVSSVGRMSSCRWVLEYRYSDMQRYYEGEWRLYEPEEELEERCTHVWSICEFGAAKIPVNEENEAGGDADYGAGETSEDGISQGTEGISINCIDNDSDGYYAYHNITCLIGNDCNDSNASINPGAIEICNGIDDDCDGEIDEDVCHGYNIPTIILISTLVLVVVFIISIIVLKMKSKFREKSKLRDYTVKCLGQGYNIQQIRQSLINQGYNLNDIDKILSEINNIK